MPQMMSGHSSFIILAWLPPKAAMEPCSRLLILHRMLGRSIGFKALVCGRQKQSIGSMTHFVHVGLLEP
jgi:hypothetical protein